MNDPAAYVREVERYLCQRNGGHLVRIVGPAFELVREWAVRGMPLRIVFRAIDRCSARQDPKRARRRPLRIEFCEADVLDAFDEWQRAVGVAGGDRGDVTPEARGRKPPLTRHLERAIARLAHARGNGPASTDYHHHLDAIIRELEDMASVSTRVRGEARASLIHRLGQLDEALLSAATDALDPARAEALGREAVADLAPFGARMPDDVRARTLEAAYRRLVREESRLPTLTYE